MTDKQIKFLAEKIARDIFVESRAVRLEFKTADNRSLGGWGRAPFTDQVERSLRDLIPTTKPEPRSKKITALNKEATV
jgi:hypothetical protein